MLDNILRPANYIFSGIVPSATIQMDMYWKEMDADSDWVGS